MGYGFCETTDLFYPPLTVIYQDPREMVRFSAQILLEEIREEKRFKQINIKIDEEFLWNGLLKSLKS